MSDPVKNVEIEDVLSSIRRLVTEKNRPPPRQNLTALDNRLVLTPALRVAESPDADTGPGQEVQAAGGGSPERSGESDDPAAGTAGGDGVAIDMGVDELDFSEARARAGRVRAGTGIDIASLDDIAGEPPDDTATPETASGRAKDAPWSDPDATLFQAVQDAPLELAPAMMAPPGDPADAIPADQALDDRAAGQAGGAGDETGGAGGETGGPGREAADPAGDCENRDGPDAAFAGQAGGKASGDGPADDAPSPDSTGDPAAGETGAGPEADDTGTTGFAGNLAEFAALDRDASRAGLADTDRRAASLSVKIQALEAAIAETQDQWEPDGQIGDDYAGTPVQTIQWRDHDPLGDPQGDDGRDALPGDPPEVELVVETAAPAQAQQDPRQEPQAPSASDFLAGEETFLDEESLRELVADIVRQELQGALGERITRNVRKLVRREIHRALTAQELD